MMMTALPVASVVAERQRLHLAERAARRNAEEAAARAARLQIVTAALARAAGTEDVARLVVQHGMEILGAQTGGLVLATAEGAAFRAVYGSARQDGLNAAVWGEERRISMRRRRRTAARRRYP